MGRMKRMSPYFTEQVGGLEPIPGAFRQESVIMGPHTKTSNHSQLSTKLGCYTAFQWNTLAFFMYYVWLLYLVFYHKLWLKWTRWP